MSNPGSHSPRNAGPSVALRSTSRCLWPGRTQIRHGPRPRRRSLPTHPPANQPLDLLDPDLRAHPRMDAALDLRDSVDGNGGQRGAGDERLLAAGDEVERGEIQTLRCRDRIATDAIQIGNEPAAELMDGRERVRLAADVLSEQ